MTKQEIANWIKQWMKEHPGCQELDSMYKDFSNLRDSTVYDVGEMTSLISGLHPLKYMTYIPPAMFYAGDITNVIISNNITSIDGSAFEKCSSLTSAEIPNSVTRIGAHAFMCCKSLISIIIPKSITCIEKSTFAFCSSLTSVVIPTGVTNIKEFAFSNCTNLTTITFNGTKAQWNSIQFDHTWNMDSGINQIKCTDGTININ